MPASAMPVKYFHEHGHLVDFAGSTPISSSAVFRQALQDDYDWYIMKYMQDNGISDRQVAHGGISRDLIISDLNSSVSDILGGLSGGTIDGGWGHRMACRSRNPDNIAVESFAHLFEVQFNKQRMKIFFTYFPQAASVFESLLKGII